MTESEHDPIERAVERIEDARDEARELEPLVAKAHVASRWQTVRRFWPLLLLATVAITLVSSGVLHELNLKNLQDHHGELQALAHANPLLVRFALWATIVVLIVTGLPGSPLMAVAGGLLFGIAEGALWSVLGDTSGALILYALTRRSLTDGNPSTPGVLIGKLKHGFANHPTSYCLFLRIVPVFPFSAVSIALAWLNCRWKTFLWTTALGVAPSAVVYAAIGDGFEAALKQHRALNLDMLSEPRFLLPMIGMGVLALLPVLMGLRKR